MKTYAVKDKKLFAVNWSTAVPSMGSSVFVPPRPLEPPTYTCYSILFAFHKITYIIMQKRHLQFNYAAKL